MKLLPVALDVRKRACLVVGGGPVGARKAIALLECEADVTILAPALCDASRALITRCKHLERGWASGDCAGFSLVWACTPSLAVNEAVAREARQVGAWCGISGAGVGGDLSGAAAIYRGEICIGISSGGGSPALSRHLKGRVEAAVGTEYEILLVWMSQQRPQLKERLESQGARAEVWRQVLDGGVLELLREGHEEEARALFASIVGTAG